MMSKDAVEKRKRVMVFGTFDGIHPGHMNFFRQAKKLASNTFLIASVARDRNVKSIKGILPEFSERKRLAIVKACSIIDKVVLAGSVSYLPHILKEKPHIIALGYDQTAYVKDLKKDLAVKGLLVKIVRLKPYKEKIYKSSLLKKNKI